MPIVLFAKSETTIPSVFQQLCVLNPYWTDYEQEVKHSILQQQLSLQVHEELVQLHLQLVEGTLRQRDVRHLSKYQQANRQYALNILRNYWQEALFPKNTQHCRLMPYFIDQYNTACAVGHILRESGEKELVQQIQKENNFAYIRQMRYPQLYKWAKKMGLTLAELQWIQPAYQPLVDGRLELKNPACGQMDGHIDVTIVNYGTDEPYVNDTAFVQTNWLEVTSPLWKALGHSYSLNNLTSGVYQTSLEAPVWSPCVTNLTVLLDSEDAPQITADIQHPFCTGEAEGNITLNISGGTPPYTVDWFDVQNNYLGSGMTLEQLKGAPTDIIAMCMSGVGFNYRVNVTDANGCQAFKTFLLTEQAEPFYVTYGEYNAPRSNCGQADATLSFNISESIEASNTYTYQWSHDSELTEAVAKNVGVGRYTVTITNNYGCSRVAQFNVSEMDTERIFVQQKENVRCNQLGMIEIYMNDTTRQYQYTWSHQTDLDSPLAEDLEVGIYTVSVTHENGCIATESFEVTRYDGLQLPHPIVNNPLNGSDGSIALDLFNPDAYTYTWSHNEELQEPIATNLAAGVYSVTVTDTYGCTAIRQVQLTGSDEVLANETVLDEQFSLGVKIANNPVKNVLKGIISKNYNNKYSSVVLTIFNLIGTQIYSQVVNERNINLDVSAYPQGIYLLQIADGQQTHSQKFLKN